VQGLNLIVCLDIKVHEKYSALYFVFHLLILYIWYRCDEYVNICNHYRMYQYYVRQCPFSEVYLKYIMGSTAILR